ncbi:MAG: M15 family metallopeptidase [Sodaliphilus sp.]
MKKGILFIAFVSMLAASASACSPKQVAQKQKPVAAATCTRTHHDSVAEELAQLRKQCQAIIDLRKAQAKFEDTNAKSKSAADPTGFVVITDYVDAIVELRYFSNYNFVGCRVDGYEEPVALATREATIALAKVAKELRKKGYIIKIFDAYRPQMAVDHFVRWSKDLTDVRTKQDFYPAIHDKTTLFPTYIATHSGHSKGSTIDLTIVDAATLQDVDMGGTFDYFGARSHYITTGLTPQQKANRKILHDAMMKYGFNYYAEEWWHFTLKNQPYPNTYFTFPVTTEYF